MALELPFGVKNLSANPLDGWYHKAAGGAYASLAEAKSLVPQSVRYNGITVMISGLGEYWWTTDLTDAGLVVKSGGGGGSGSTASETVFNSYDYYRTTPGVDTTGDIRVYYNENGKFTETYNGTSWVLVETSGNGSSGSVATQTVFNTYNVYRATASNVDSEGDVREYVNATGKYIERYESGSWVLKWRLLWA